MNYIKEFWVTARYYRKEFWLTFVLPTTISFIGFALAVYFALKS